MRLDSRGANSASEKTATRDSAASFRPRLFDSVVGRDTWLAREKQRDGDYSGGTGGVNCARAIVRRLTFFVFVSGSKPISCVRADQSA